MSTVVVVDCVFCERHKFFTLGKSSGDRISPHYYRNISTSAVCERTGEAISRLICVTGLAADEPVGTEQFIRSSDRILFIFAGCE